MTRTEKNKTKRLAKVFSILTWTITGIFFTCLILLISGPFLLIPSVTVRLIAFFAPLFIGLVFMFTYTGYSANLQQYRRDIWNKRQWFYVYRIVELLKANDIQSAVDIYNDCLVQRQYMVFMNGILISEFRHSSDPIWNAKAEENLQRIFNDIKV